MTGDCVLWTGSIDTRGYGYVKADGRTYRAHRLAYEEAHGEIPEGLVIDHLCRVRACVNPDHMEAVTQRVNVLRGESLQAQNARKTECIRGHAFDDENTLLTADGRRQCRTCTNARQLRRYHERKAS